MLRFKRAAAPRICSRLLDRLRSQPPTSPELAGRDCALHGVALAQANVLGEARGGETAGRVSRDARATRHTRSPVVIGQHFEEGSHRKEREIYRGAVGGGHLAQLLRHLNHLQHRVAPDAAVARVRRRHILAEGQRARVDEEVVVVGVCANHPGQHSGGNIVRRARAAVHLLPVVEHVVACSNVKSRATTNAFAIKH